MSRRLAPLLLVLAAPAFAGEPKLVSVAKIWDAGPHNAFTDLIRWKGRFHCTFREAEAHVGGDGGLRVLASDDGSKWEPVALVTEPGIDLRDPKFSVTPDGRLMIVAGGSVYQGRTLVGRQPRVTFSADGRTWTPPRRVLSEGEWLWRVEWNGGKAYGVSYDSTPSDGGDWKLTLFSSDDGIDYKAVSKLDVPGKPNETTLRFLPDGEVLAIVRREGGDMFGRIGRSKPPYTDWTWREVPHRLGGPN